MSKFATFCATPITWGAYLKLAGICMATSIVFSVGWIAFVNIYYDKV